MIEFSRIIFHFNDKPTHLLFRTNQIKYYDKNIYPHNIIIIFGFTAVIIIFLF